MPDQRTKNRRNEPEVGEWWEVVMNMGMPTLYIIGLISGMSGAICNGVITHYWSNLQQPMCFLYADTASNQLFYTFGSSIAICNWVTYGAVTGIIIAFLTGLLFIIQCREDKELNLYITLVDIGSFLAFLFLLAVTCTLAEGMRKTCASMGLNTANNKGSSCYDKLDIRVSQYNLPIETSTMVRASMAALIFATITFFIVLCFHISDTYSRYRRASFHSENRRKGLYY